MTSTQQSINSSHAFAYYLHIEYTAAASRVTTAAHDAGSDLQYTESEHTTAVMAPALLLLLLLVLLPLLLLLFTSPQLPPLALPLLLLLLLLRVRQIFRQDN